MDTPTSQSYVSLTLAEIKQRFEEMMAADEQPGFSLEEPEPVRRAAERFNPYDRG